MPADNWLGFPALDLRSSCCKALGDRAKGTSHHAVNDVFPHTEQVHSQEKSSVKDSKIKNESGVSNLWLSTSVTSVFRYHETSFKIAWVKNELKYLTCLLTYFLNYRMIFKLCSRPISSLHMKAECLMEGNYKNSKSQSGYHCKDMLAGGAEGGGTSICSTF